MSLALAFALAAASTAPPACAARSGRAVRPLVELYTSEGCSSCPPADRWFARHAHGDGATWLAFHVDYWDDLGWRDRYGDVAHSRRQRERSWAWSSPTVYTPQVMVGPRIHAPWRDERAFAAMLAAQRAPARAGLAIRIEREGEGTVAWVAATRAQGTTGEAQLWIAAWDDHATTRVGAGENAGATLRHEGVVRRLWGPWPLEAGPRVRRIELDPPLPTGGIAAFVQERRGVTWQSLALPLAACGTGR
jgi:hypothetical protein